MKKTIYLTSLLTILACSLLSNRAYADVIPDNETVSGMVVDKDGQPLPGAKVEIEGQSISIFTDLDGRFSVKCKPGAKNILVTYPKAPNVKTRIKPNMTVKMGRTWRDAPDHYQWFVGGSVGVGLTSVFANQLRGAHSPLERGELHHTYAAPTFSVMGGRVKDVGWYAKAFYTVSYDYENYGFIPEGYSDSYTSTHTSGAIIGGMVRMGCPLHLCLGVGIASTTIDGIPEGQYDKLNWQIDFGFLYRIKNHFGVSMTFNAGVNNYFNYVAGSYANIGVQYFFNK